MSISRSQFACTMVAIITVAGAPPSIAQTTQPAIAHIDEAAFRAGLRERGLTEWLDQYAADEPAMDGVDARLREREALLEKAVKVAGRGGDASEAVEEAHGILIHLLDGHRDHPGRLRWHLESARDCLERLDPAVFERLLLYDLPGRDRNRVAVMAQEAVQTLEVLQGEIDDQWSIIEQWDEVAVREAIEAGWVRRLEIMADQAEWLLLWARFYDALSADDDDASRRERMASLHAGVTDATGWVESPSPARRCGALVVAAVSARVGGQFADANRYARHIISAYREIRDQENRDRLRWAGVLSMLEQIRVHRDEGQFDAALAGVNQAKEWASQARPGDVQVALALAMIHRSVLKAQERSPGVLTTRPSGSSFFEPLGSLEPIREVCERAPVYRDAMYALLAPVVPDEVEIESEPAFVLQIRLGSALFDASRREQIPSALRERIDRLADRAEVLVQEGSTDDSTMGELHFLLGRARWLTGEHSEACKTLIALAEGAPKHDRAVTAADQAVSIAQHLLAGEADGDGRGGRDAFIQAVRVLGSVDPESTRIETLRYFVAVALERNGDLQDAAEAYAKVRDDAPRRLEAGLGRARCLYHALEAFASIEEGARIEQAAESALSAARQAMEYADSLPATDQSSRTRAEIVLLLARVLSHEALARHDEAIAVLDGFEKRFGDQDDLVGAVLSARILAYRDLNRLSEARAVVARYLEAEPTRAGAVMVDLLDTMRAEVIAADNRDEAATRRELAGETVTLCDMLREWLRVHGKLLSGRDLVTIDVIRAWALRLAGKSQEAMTAYEQCAEAVSKASGDTSALELEIRLGVAECLLDEGRHEEALPEFALVWNTMPERSDPWWRALVGSLTCHTELGSDPVEIVQSVRQQRQFAPDLGQPRWGRVLAAIERTNLQRLERGGTESPLD